MSRETAAKAPAVESTNRATDNCSAPDPAKLPLNVTVMYKVDDADTGVKARDIYSSPSAICGTVSSNGMIVVPVAKVPVCVEAD
tara:strand:+ start:287 stop:538 length:252 start_codon:yes stop_codon:yes gene_type:complete